MIFEGEIYDIFMNCDRLPEIACTVDDLIDSVINVVIAEECDELAVTVCGWIDDWLEMGYSESQVVNIFFALINLVRLDNEAVCGIEVLMDEISEYLESK